MDTDDPPKVMLFDQVVLADALPPSLEALCLRGYREGVRLDFDESITRFLAEKDAKLPNLQKVTGIKKYVASVMRSFCWGATKSTGPRMNHSDPIEKYYCIESAYMN
jgi:hypothetical protein